MVVQVDANPFKQWYQKHYGVEVGVKGKDDGTSENLPNFESMKDVPMLRIRPRGRELCGLLGFGRADQRDEKPSGSEEGTGCASGRANDHRSLDGNRRIAPWSDRKSGWIRPGRQRARVLHQEICQEEGKGSSRMTETLYDASV